MSKRNWIVGGLALSLTAAGAAHGAAAPYPTMAPRSQYMMDRSQEIAMARTAAPPSISADATILVLGAHGFETAVKGTNQFVCMVDRAWNKSYDDPEFWNPKVRGPICMNDAAVRTALPQILEHAEWALSGLSLAEMRERAKTSAIENMAPAPGAMSFMLSKEQYLADPAGQSTSWWHPHVMFFSPKIDPAAWGANLKDSPIVGLVISGKFTMFYIPVRKWSDGTLADYGPAAQSTSEHHH